jgi:predicted nuclease of predicted toxin-antitoxin system
VHAKLLLDENLSPRVAKALCVDGVDAVHLRDRGFLGATDALVLELAYAEDRVLVTVNVADFVKLARARELHAGIVLIEDGALLVDEQLVVIKRAVVILEGEPDLVNRLLWINLAGEHSIEDVPPPEST